MAALRVQYADYGDAIEALPLARLRDYFSPETLASARVITARTKLPFPPIADLGIAFAELAQMALSGVTYDDLVFVHESQRTDRTLFHELVHVVQWRTLGVDRFLLTYGAGLAERGYAHNPLEAIAYDLQSQFDRGLPIANVEAVVSAHARATAAGYDEWFDGAKE